MEAPSVAFLVVLTSLIAAGVANPVLSNLVLSNPAISKAVVLSLKLRVGYPSIPRLLG
jgi:hypothetical protein